MGTGPSKKVFARRPIGSPTRYCRPTFSSQATTTTISVSPVTFWSCQMSHYAITPCQRKRQSMRIGCIKLPNLDTEIRFYQDKTSHGTNGTTCEVHFTLHLKTPPRRKNNNFRVRTVKKHIRRISINFDRTQQIVIHLESRVKKNTPKKKRMIEPSREYFSLETPTSLSSREYSCLPESRQAQADENLRLFSPRPPLPVSLVLVLVLAGTGAPVVESVLGYAARLAPMWTCILHTAPPAADGAQSSHAR